MWGLSRLPRMTGREDRIRTCGTPETPTAFPMQHHRPLGHLSTIASLPDDRLGDESLYLIEHLGESVDDVFVDIAWFTIESNYFVRGLDGVCVFFFEDHFIHDSHRPCDRIIHQYCEELVQLRNFEVEVQIDIIHHHSNHLHPVERLPPDAPYLPPSNRCVKILVYSEVQSIDAELLSEEIMPEVTLRPLTMDDFDAVHDYAGDPDVTKIFRWGPNTPEETHRIMQWWLDTDYPLVRGIENQDGVIVGVIELRRDGGVGYTLRKAFWHQGYASAALPLMIDIARERGFELVFGTCRETNMASRTILGKEMTQEGKRMVNGVEMLYFYRKL